MGCRSDYMEPTPAEREAPLRKELDRLTRENDLLREMVINLDQGGKLTATELKLVKRHQIAHRKEDLARLERTLRELIATAQAGDDSWIEVKDTGKRIEIRQAYERLGRVITADPVHPLEPQLGFDPDSL